MLISYCIIDLSFEESFNLAFEQDESFVEVVSSVASDDDVTWALDGSSELILEGEQNVFEPT